MLVNAPVSRRGRSRARTGGALAGCQQRRADAHLSLGGRSAWAAAGGTGSSSQAGEPLVRASAHVKDPVDRRLSQFVDELYRAAWPTTRRSPSTAQAPEPEPPGAACSHRRENRRAATWSRSARQRLFDDLARRRRLGHWRTRRQLTRPLSMPPVRICPGGRPPARPRSVELRQETAAVLCGSQRAASSALRSERVEYPSWWPHPVRVPRAGGVRRSTTSVTRRRVARSWLLTDGHFVGTPAWAGPTWRGAASGFPASNGLIVRVFGTPALSSTIISTCRYSLSRSWGRRRPLGQFSAVAPFASAMQAITIAATTANGWERDHDAA